MQKVIAALLLLIALGFSTLAAFWTLDTIGLIEGGIAVADLPIIGDRTATAVVAPFGLVFVIFFWVFIKLLSVIGNAVGAVGSIVDILRDWIRKSF